MFQQMQEFDFLEKYQWIYIRTAYPKIASLTFMYVSMVQKVVKFRLYFPLGIWQTLGINPHKGWLGG